MDVRSIFRGLPGADAWYEAEAQRPSPKSKTLTQNNTPPHEDPTMTNLKSRVSGQEYSVDSNLVAAEILRKLRMIRWARHKLVSGPGRTPRPKLRGL